ncbi:MAG TPA: SgcJ/EcaC family oxidoreductase [Gemmataceae bacterium]|nr:SgcJ/EcaC family oxidoreductase [Gemmataceae bacterium]
MLKNPKNLLTLLGLAALVGFGIVTADGKPNAKPSGRDHAAEYGLRQGQDPEEGRPRTVALQGSRPGTEAEQAIRKAIQEHDAAFNRGDLQAFLAHWDRDAEFIDETGKVTRGRNALAVLFRKSLEDNKGSKLRVQITSLRFPRPDVALVDGPTEVTSPDGSKDAGRYTSVWVKTDGRWLISSVRDLPAEAGSAALSASDHLKQLDWLIGDWVVADDKADVQVSCRWDANQSFLVLDFTVKQPDKEFTLSQRMGWDPINGQIRSWCFDSMGGFGEALWTRDGNQWTADATGALPDGRAGSARNTLRFVNEDSWVWQSTDRAVDALPLTDVEVRFARKPAKH